MKRFLKLVFYKTVNFRLLGKNICYNADMWYSLTQKKQQKCLNNLD